MGGGKEAAGKATVPGGGGQPGQGAMRSLPDPAAYKGRVIRDTRTGKRLQSNGQQWQPME
jgi:hypothetical protein